MKRFEFHKLIRDKLPDRMDKEGVVVNSRILNQAEYLQELKNKLVEEANEVKDASKEEHIIRELADVMEVIYTITKEIGIDFQIIEEERLKKLALNGCFKPQNYINFIELAKDNRKVIKYLEDKDRDPVFAENPSD